MNREKSLCPDIYIFFLTACFFVFFPALLHAQSIIPKNLVVDNTNGLVALHFDLEIQKKKQIEQALMAGETLYLRLKASLCKKRLLFRNETVSKKKINWQFSGNPVSQQLMVIQDTAPSMLARKDFWENLEGRMTNLELFFIPWERIQADQKDYFIVLEVELGRELPNWAKLIDTFWRDALEQKNRYEMSLYN